MPIAEVDGRPVGLAEVDQAPGGGVGQDFVLRIPLERDADELRLESVGAQLADQFADVVFRPPFHEGDLRFADHDAAGRHAACGADALGEEKASILRVMSNRGILTRHCSPWHPGDAKLKRKP